MNVLLDTHAFIWFLEANPSLSAKARSIIEDDAHQKFISMASFFEMAIKIKIGKLTPIKPLKECYADAIEHGITILPIAGRCLFEYDNVPMKSNHRDPFDRLLIATAIFENMPIITTDSQFDNYKELVQLIW